MRTRRQIDEREPDGVSPTDPIWSRVRALIRAFNLARIIDGRFLDTEPKAIDGSGLVFTAGQVRTIPHKLGRRATGFFEVSLPDVPSAGHVGLYAVKHPDGVSSEDYITVKATSAGTCAIWVY